MTYVCDGPRTFLPRSRGNYRQLLERMHERLDIHKPLILANEDWRSRLLNRVRESVDAEWTEELHPRGPGGKFAETNTLKMKPKVALKHYGWKLIPHLTKLPIGGHALQVYRHPVKGEMRIWYKPKRVEHVDENGVAHNPGFQRLPEYLRQLHSGDIKPPQQIENKPVAGPKSPVHEVEKKLSTGEISSQKKLGGGVCQTSIITLSDGTKAVFKLPANYSTVGNETSREVGVWELAQVVGMEDLVSPAVKRTIDGREGALIEYKPGEVAKNVRDPFDGARDCARAALFDYVIANTDRHKGNWVVEGGSKLHLIDHGLSFPDQLKVWKGQGFIKAVAGDLEKFDKEAPLHSFAKAYTENVPEIKAALTRAGVPGRCIDFAVDRINALKQYHNWGELIQG